MLLVCKMPCLFMDFDRKGLLFLLCYFAGLPPKVPVLICGSSLSEVFLKLAVTKKKVKSFKYTREEVYFFSIVER